MTRCSSVAAKAVLGLVLLTGTAQAAEIKVISSDGVASVLDTLKPEYEHASGNTLVIHYGAANLLKKGIMDGEPFDVTILTGEVMDEMIKAGKLVSGTRADIARAGFGVAYKAGSPRPDIHDAASFKAAMLAAQSVSYMAQGASGVYFSSLADKLGIADQVKGKAKVLPSNRVIRAVADGEAQIRHPGDQQHRVGAGCRVCRLSSRSAEVHLIFRSDRNGLPAAAGCGGAAQIPD